MLPGFSEEQHPGANANLLADKLTTLLTEVFIKIPDQKLSLRCVPLPKEKGGGPEVGGRGDAPIHW